MRPHRKLVSFAYVTNSWQRLHDGERQRIFRVLRWHARHVFKQRPAARGTVVLQVGDQAIALIGKYRVIFDYDHQLMMLIVREICYSTSAERAKLDTRASRGESNS